MLKQVLLDNDVVLKVACYSLPGEMVSATSFDGTRPAMLGVGKFVIWGRLARSSKIADAERAKAAFDYVLQEVALLEPDDEELSMAADLEAAANQSSLELDGGESQLLAILLNRGARLLITGDKRAIHAIGIISKTEVGERIACLEQLIAHFVRVAGLGAVHSRICAEPRVDRAISICFGCPDMATDQEGVLEALASYITHLSSEVPGVLVSDCEFASSAP